jgi:hypothetical protein
MLQSTAAGNNLLGTYTQLFESFRYECLELSFSSLRRDTVTKQHDSRVTVLQRRIYQDSIGSDRNQPRRVVHAVRICRTHLRIAEALRTTGRTTFYVGWNTVCKTFRSSPSVAQGRGQSARCVRALFAGRASPSCRRQPHHGRVSHTCPTILLFPICHEASASRRSIGGSLPSSRARARRDACGRNICCGCSIELFARGTARIQLRRLVYSS